MEVKNKKAIVLTKDGTFERVSLKKGQQAEIGSEIDVPVSRNYFNSYTKRISTFVAAAAVLVLFLTQYPFLQTNNLVIAAYVGVDINPSLEVGVNENLKVVEVIPINEDGKIIVDQINDDFRNKSLAEFIDDTIELAKADGYLAENKDVLLTTTTINKEAQVKIEEKVTVIKKDIEKSGVEVTTLKGDENTRKEAKDIGVSTGKYLIYKESKENLTIEETKELSVTQIYEKLDKVKQKKDNVDKVKERKMNKEEKIDKDTKKEQKADIKQQKSEDNKNDKKPENAPVKVDKIKNKDSNPSNEPPSKNKVKENNSDNGKYDNKKKDNSEKHVDQQQPNKDKKENKNIKEKDNKDEQKDKNNSNKEEN